MQVLDDQSSTGAALRDIYDELGIALFDNEGQLRSSYDIFSDLAEIWDTLDANTQNYIASQQAGTNQFKWDCFHSNMIEKAYRIAGSSLEIYELQCKDEISLSTKV